MSATVVISGDEEATGSEIITVYHRPYKCSIAQITEISLDNEQRALAFAAHPLRESYQDTRLLVLLPAPTVEDEVCCEFRVVSLRASSEKCTTSEASHYEALSYTWGESANSRSITLGGRAGFKVTDNLHAALVRLRRADRHRILWVDGLCIDHDNNVERNWQVALIPRALKAADSVIVWLGDYESQYEPTATRESDREQWLRQSSRALGHALQEPLWSESAWSMQAAVLATVPPTFQFGSVTWSWELLRRELNHSPTGMIHFLPNLARREAADPRDMVYCLLGLVKEGESALVSPSYDEPPAQCFSKATFALVSSEKHLACIGLAQHGDMPSWAIDFTLSGCEVDNAQLELARSTLSKMRRRDVWEDYLFEMPPPPSLNEDGSRLRLSSFLLDRVADTTPVSWAASQRSATCHEREGYRSSLRALFSSMPRTHPRQALMQGDRPVALEPGLESPDWTSLKSILGHQLLDTERLGLHLAGAWYSATGLESPFLTSLWWKTILDYSKIISDPEPVWFRSSYGFVGYSPRLLEPDDVLCLVTSDTHPMILRKTGDGYTFVCFAWVPGIMNHEIDGILYEIGATDIELI
ncbi:hypothetical protein KVR01_009076 [Diaporthe batatas]|uniref:uncharacterized protein n=1 Tax=Diaporthe batatas TaxID=748121 RepID=UPI001D03EA22|nr:uncharacterized protein KVR01_009076 [Diaporthe batatas]KAG8160812.1 hypothetical protein KVR01_009076 [Diaporthe batatas]